MNPYETLDYKAFWKLAIAEKDMFEITDIWNPKFDISLKDKVVTYGACFTQYFADALRNKNYNWFSTELAPVGLSKKNKHRFNYDIFSSRTGNIYTTSMLKQWVEWALEIKEVPNEVWEVNDRYYDPFRPSIEPNGFFSEEEVLLSRAEAIKAFKSSFQKSNIFMFTLGLTESWHNIEYDYDYDYEYPICPGTAAGVFDENKHIFKNQDFAVCNSNLIEAIKLMKSVNKKLKFIITISPVPITATNSGNHILIANMETKSILRAVSTKVSRRFNFVDYFPAYELVNSPNYKGVFFARNQRSITDFGVNFVMDVFFDSLDNKFGNRNNKQVFKIKSNDCQIVCEEEILNAFGK